MAAWSPRLTAEVGLSQGESTALATCVAAEVRFLPSDAKAQIIGASPVPIRARLDELRAFQGWMESVGGGAHPAMVRAQVITQIYVCFVYLPEACFSVLAKSLPGGSTGRKCARFLTSDMVRRFRNAAAHANWTYTPDFTGITYWARKGDYQSPLAQFEVRQDELTFWQALSRGVAYAALSNLA
jgi:hypothetical protein